MPIWHTKWHTNSERRASEPADFRRLAVRDHPALAMPTDPDREIAYWRDLLTRIAEDLESTADLETDGKRKSWFTSRAMRVNRCTPRASAA